MQKINRPTLACHELQAGAARFLCEAFGAIHLTLRLHPRWEPHDSDYYRGTLLDHSSLAFVLIHFQNIDVVPSQCSAAL